MVDFANNTDNVETLTDAQAALGFGSCADPNALSLTSKNINSALLYVQLNGEGGGSTVAALDDLTDVSTAGGAGGFALVQQVGGDFALEDITLVEEFEDVRSFRYSLSANQSVTASNFDAVEFDVEEFDQNDDFDAVGHRFTVPADLIGKVMNFTCGVRISAAASYTIYLSVRDSADVSKHAAQLAINNTDRGTVSLGDVILAAGDYVVVQVFSSSTITVLANQATFFSGHEVTGVSRVTSGGGIPLQPSQGTVGESFDVFPRYQAESAPSGSSFASKGQGFFFNRDCEITHVTAKVGTFNQGMRIFIFRLNNDADLTIAEILYESAGVNVNTQTIHFVTFKLDTPVSVSDGELIGIVASRDGVGGTSVMGLHSFTSEDLLSPVNDKPVDDLIHTLRFARLSGDISVGNATAQATNQSVDYAGLAIGFKCREIIAA